MIFSINVANGFKFRLKFRSFWLIEIASFLAMTMLIYNFCLMIIAGF
jgi:hypothetical protein